MSGFDDIMLSLPEEARAILVTAFFMALGALIGVISWRAARRRQKRESDAEWEKRLKYNSDLIKQDIIRKLENDRAFWRGRAEVYREQLSKYAPLLSTTAYALNKLAADIGAEVASERVTE